MWSSLDLTAGKTPVLYDGETQITLCRMVGLYDGDTKSPDHAQGWIYLTTRRLCYVDDTHPEENSCAIELSQLKSASYSQGFLRQSPKIELLVTVAAARDSPRTWVCEICSFSNSLSPKYVPGQSELPRCENCGVQAASEPKIQPAPAPAPNTEPSTTHSGSDCDANTCPRCTFVNHPYIRECEICGYTLKQHTKVVSLGDRVRLSFRAGGAKEFFSALQAVLGNNSTLSADVPASTPAGAPTDILRLGINQLRTDPGTLDFGSVRAIETNAREIVALLEAHSRIAADYTPSYPLEGHLVFRDYFRDDKSYLVQLARQIADFLESNGILRTQGGAMTLFDVFSAYNRARGPEPVSAADLGKALDLAPELGMPIQVRSLRSGIKVIESKLWTSPQERLGSWIKRSNKPEGVSPMDVGAQFGWSFAISIEELEQAEDLGVLCRDDTPAGARYFANQF